MKTTLLATLAMLLTAVVGCDAPEIVAPQVSVADAGDSTPTVEATTSRVPDTTVEHPEWYLPDGRLDMSGVPGEPPMTTSVPREVLPKDPKKGKLTRRRGGKMLGTTLQALPWATNQITFLQIKSQLATYDALHGHFPKSHDEFMTKFMPELCPQLLPLPELEAGDEYIYDPEDHLLKIYRPEG